MIISDKNIFKSMYNRVTVMCVVVILLFASNVYAISLADSFSGSSSYSYVKRITGGDVWKKTTTAKTVGYNKRHYVRAYIGGSSSSASGAVADSGKVYSSGDVTAKASNTKTIFDNLNKPYQLYFKTGYAKYGH